MVLYSPPSTSKPRLVIVGGGWAGFYIAEKIDYSKYTVTVISPRRTQAYTPLLASAAVGLFGFYLAEEPVRSKSRQQLRFHKAYVTDIDFRSKACHCRPAFDEKPALTASSFSVDYDLLVLAPGCEPNTFGTPGADDNAIFVKNVSDAMRIRKELFDRLEEASLPHVPTERAKELLHIAIVGGGPTGIELTAELDDVAHKELVHVYPQVAPLVKVSVYDVAPNILGAYDRNLHEYATGQLTKRHVEVATNTHIEKVDADALYIKEQGRVPYGMLLWATGNKNVDLVETLSGRVRLPEKGLKRLQTDTCLRLYGASDSLRIPQKGEDRSSSDSGSGGGSGGKSRNQSSTVTITDEGLRASDEIVPDVFALGDAADIVDRSLPTTAEVAVQKAKYLVDQLNSQGDLMSGPFSRPFEYKEKQMVSYIGRHDGVVTGPKKDKKEDKKDDDDDGDGEEEEDPGWTGRSAWLTWRRGALYWNRSWRSRVAIVFSWGLNWAFGTEIAKL